LQKVISGAIMMIHEKEIIMPSTNKTNQDSQNLTQKEPGKKKNPKQIAALVGVIILVLMYLGTLLLAIFDTSSAGALFQVCLVATLFIPILIWIYIWMYGKITGKDTIADPFVNDKKEE